MRPLVHFFVLGALLLAAQGMLQRLRPEADKPTLRIVVRQQSSASELERAIDEAVLIEQAVERGGALVDPVVREQLLSSMRDRGGRETTREDDAALLERALALGLHRADPVTRQRLVFQAEQLLAASGDAATVNASELTRYLQEHAERYRREARYTLTQVVLTRAHHTDPERAARTLLSTLERLDVGADDADRWSDASLLARTVRDTSTSALDARLGPGFAAELGALPLARWSGPVRSAYGWHVVLVHEHSPARLPALAEVHMQVLADYRHDHRRALLKARLRTLRASYRLDVRRLQA